MNTLKNVLQKVFVLEFYRSNTGFFLIVLGLAGGFMRAPDHIALAEFFTSSPTFIAIPVLVWIYYTIKVFQFNSELLSRNENEFIYNVALLPKVQQWRLTIGTLFMQLVPVVFYSVFLLVIALRNEVWLTPAIVITANMVLVSFASHRFIDNINNPHVQKNRWALTRLINRSFTKPYLFFFPEWIIRRDAGKVIGTKVFACLLIYAIIQLYKSDTYDLRLFGMCVAIVFSGNAGIVGELHRFDNQHLGLLRALPIPFFRRVVNFTCVMILLLLPEMGLIIQRFPEGFTIADLLSVLFFGISIPLVQYGARYYKDATPERISTLIFVSVMILFVLVLFQIPLALLAFVNCCIGLFIWKWYYYSFEYTSSRIDSETG